MGRDVLGVERHGGPHGVEEELLGHGGHADDGRGVLHALGVAVGPEDGYGVVGEAEGLEALVRLLAVVERRRHAVQAHVRVRHEPEGAPFPGRHGVGRFDMAVDYISSTEARLVTDPEQEQHGWTRAWRPSLTFADLEAHVGPVNGIHRRRRKRRSHCVCVCACV